MSPHEYRVRLVGGVFSDGDPRSSGYFRQLAEDLWRRLAPTAMITTTNGGSMETLDILLELERAAPSDSVLWMADVPNVEAKRLPALAAIWRAHGTIVAQSKNNDGGRYTDADLTDRMRASGAEALLELVRSPEGVSGRVHRVTGARGEASTHIPRVADELADILTPSSPVFPLDLIVRRTTDPMSFQGRDLAVATELPMHPHPGAFGVERRHHRHEGVDLYAAERVAVRAMEAGTVVAIEHFTGPQAGSDWWLPTQCVMIEGASGVLNYGEIKPARSLAVGTRVDAGEVVGQVATVLREDKGRPRSMLHLERYVHGTRVPLASWGLGEVQPAQLLDPTGMLLRAARARA